MQRAVALVVAASVAGIPALAQRNVATAETEVLMVRGQAERIRLYGTRGNPPVIVSSGDGGWLNLAPHVAEVLAARGFFVVGFDVKRYLSDFTDHGETLQPDIEQRDYRMLVDFAARGSRQRPILIGVSEGAGLSILAASDAQLKNTIGGVIGLGLGDVNELGWRWRDALIYVTHKAPNEPTFRTSMIIGRVTPLPIAMIQASRDEFVPLREACEVFAAAREPKRLWVINASNHRFSSNRAEFDKRLLDALTWISNSTPGN